MDINELFKLQELDQKADKHRADLASLPEQEAYDESTTRLSELQAELTKTLKEDEQQTKIVQKLEGQMELLGEKLKKEESKLYDGKTTNPKELLSIQNEINALQAERDKEETAYLEELEKLDPLEDDLKELRKSEAESSAKSEELRKALDKKTEEIQEDLKDVEAEIAKIRKSFGDEILDLYDRLRRTKQGIAIALVKKGICQGCSLAISTDEEDKMSYGHELWRCEHCKRILVER